MKKIILAACLATPAAAQTCDDRDVVTGALAHRFGETQQGYGYAPTSQGGFVAEVYANPETGTWTILMTMDDGQMCLVMHGDRWRTAPTGDPA